MTPDEARRLLDNFDRLLPFEAELEIEGAAKDMAAMIAGMHEEWGVRWDGDPSYGPYDWGFPTRAAAEQWEKKNRHYGPERGRVVRRYTTEPEAG